MVPAALSPLLCCAAFALPAALLARADLAAAALWAMLGLLAARHLPHRCRLSGLCALPAMLAAVPSPAAPPHWPRPGPVVVYGTVADVVRAPEHGVTWVTLADGRSSLRLQFDAPVELLPGDRLHTYARLTAPMAPDLPPLLHGIAATVRVDAGAWSLPRAAAAARRALERQLLRLLPDDRGTMLATLLLGRGTRSTAELANAHRATGLSHLLAVSGAHAAMLAMLLGLVGRGRRLAASRRRTVLVLGVLFAYGAITGNEPPVVRAVATFALAALATRIGRPFPLATGLLAPALLTCLWQPDALLGPSFLLSYAAVIGLALAGMPAGDPGLWRWFLASVRGSCWATLLTAPLTLFFFGQLAPWTVLLTPLLSPLVALLLFGSLLTALLGLLLPAVAAALAVPLAAAASLYMRVVQAADALPGTPVPAWCLPPTWLLVLAGALALLLLAWHRDRRGAALAAAVLIAPYFAPLHRRSPPRLRLFAIGHGQACLYTAADRTVVVDCGSVQAPTMAAREVLRALEHRHIDLLICSHGDADHRNGIEALLRAVPIAAAILPVSLRDSELARSLREHATQIRLLAPGQHLEPLPGLAVAAPELPAGASDNDRSLWSRFHVGGASVLLTGDAEALGTAAAIAQGIAQRSDVLLLPHHGRPNPTAAHLLQRVRPRVCLASAASADGDTALGSLARAFGADLWVTGQHGTIELLGSDPPRVRASADGRPLPAARQESPRPP